MLELPSRVKFTRSRVGEGIISSPELCRGWKTIRTFLSFVLDFDPFGAGEAPAGEGAETEPVTGAAETADEEFLFEQVTVQAPVGEMSNLEVAAEPEPSTSLSDF